MTAEVVWYGEPRPARGWPLDRPLTDRARPALLSLGGEAAQLAEWRRQTGRYSPAPAPEQLISPAEERRLRAALARLSPAARRRGSVRAQRTLLSRPLTGQRAQSAPALTTGGTTMASGKTERLSGPKLAEQVLIKADRPVHVKLIAERVLAEDRKLAKANRRYQGKTPEQTISAALTVSSNGEGTFVKVAPGVFALRAWPASKRNKTPELPERTTAERKPSANGSSAAKRSGSSSAPAAPRKRSRKTKAEKDAAIAEAQAQEEQKGSGEAEAEAAPAAA